LIFRSLAMNLHLLPSLRIGPEPWGTLEPTTQRRDAWHGVRV
jgi:hypothetical protein